MNNNYPENNNTSEGNNNSFGRGFADDSFSDGSFSGTDSFSGNSGFSGTDSFSGNSGIGGTNSFSGNSGFSGTDSFSGNSGFSGTDSFSGNSGIGGTNSFSGNIGFSGTDSFSGNSGFSGTNSFSGNSGIGGTDSFSGNSGFSGTDSFSGNNSFGASSPEEEYDPNAPLYHPEPMTYDPNAPLYHPDNSFPSSVHTVTAVQPKKNTAQVVVIVAVLLAVAVVLGIVGYKIFFEKKNLKQYFDTREGQVTLSKLKNDVSSGGKNIKESKAYVEGNDILVIDVTSAFGSVSASDKAVLDEYMELLKPGMQESIKNIMDSEKLKPFSVKYVLRLSGGEVFAEYTFSS